MENLNALSAIGAALETSPTKSQAVRPDGLSNFDSLPDSAYVRQPVLEGLFACGPSTIWRMVKRGALPQPKKIGPRITGWKVGEVRKVLAECDR